MTKDDPTEEIRRQLQWVFNMTAAARPVIEQRYGQVWDTEQLSAEFEVLDFAAPMVVVRRRADRQLGSLFFQHDPRLYFAWEPHEKEEKKAA